MAKEDYVRLNLDDFVGLFKALGDPARLDMVGLLYEYEATAATIAAALELVFDEACEDLRALKQAGIVADRQRGRSTVYTLTPRARDLMMALSSAAPTRRRLIRRRG
jgi:DNA-binding transcriptional ArsR family regulator